MAGLNISSRQFGKILVRNGYRFTGQSGDHLKYKHEKTGVLISIPYHLNPIIAQRLVKENNIKI